MASSDALHHQLLNAIGVAPEQHDAVIAKQRELAELREAERRAVDRNMQAVATFVGERMGLPEGLSFEYR